VPSLDEMPEDLLRLPGWYAKGVRWRIRISQRVTGSWVTDTGKRREDDLLITSMMPAGVILP
jgi:hypothetical protein